MTCTLCSESFVITEADKAFYQKMDVPEPTRCPICRFRRKAVWRNERTLYKRTCDLCKKNIVSMYRQDSVYTVYCKQCYYSDNWDPFQYALEYDAGRPFFEQVAELFHRVPKAATVTSGSNVNSEYQNWAGENKDCYMVSNSAGNEMVLYSRGMRSSRDSSDNYYCINAERTYESVNTHDSSGMRFCHSARNCLDSWFLRDCTGCANCFGCVNLRYKDYHFFNEPLSKEEYERRVADYIGSFFGLEKIKKEFNAFSRTHPFRAHHNMRSEDCTGDYIVDSKNCHDSYETDRGEECAFTYFTKTAKDSYDCIGFGFDSELLYECNAAGYSHRIVGGMYIQQSSDIEYCHGMRSCLSCIGCDGLNKAHYAILNTVYSEDTYRTLREQIIASLKRDGLWGEYFPLSLAPFAFNETIASDYYPLTKEEALSHGYVWNDDLPETTGKETQRSENIPDHIRDVKDSITKEILACTLCNRNYKVIAQELSLYRQLNVPIPRHCINCRHKDRLERRGPLRLSSRQCNNCHAKIKTPFSSEENITVLCEQCYINEVA